MPWAPSALSEVSFCTEIIDFLAWFVYFYFINSMFCRSLLNCNPKQKVWTVLVKAAMLGHTCFLWNEQEEKTWNHVWMKLMSFHLFKYLGRRQVMWWWNFVKVCLYKDMNAIICLYLWIASCRYFIKYQQFSQIVFFSSFCHKNNFKKKYQNRLYILKILIFIFSFFNWNHIFKTPSLNSKP